MPNNAVANSGNLLNDLLQGIANLSQKNQQAFSQANNQQQPAQQQQPSQGNPIQQAGNNIIQDVTNNNQEIFEAGKKSIIKNQDAQIAEAMQQGVPATQVLSTLLEMTNQSGGLPPQGNQQGSTAPANQPSQPNVGMMGQKLGAGTSIDNPIYEQTKAWGRGGLRQDKNTGLWYYSERGLANEYFLQGAKGGTNDLANYKNLQTVSGTEPVQPIEERKIAASVFGTKVGAKEKAIDSLGTQISDTVKLLGEVQGKGSKWSGRGTRQTQILKKLEALNIKFTKNVNELNDMYKGGGSKIPPGAVEEAKKRGLI